MKNKSNELSLGQLKLKQKMIFIIAITVSFFCFFPCFLNYLYVPLIFLCAVIGYKSIPYTFVIILISYTRFFSIVKIPENLAIQVTDFGVIAVCFCMLRIIINKVKMHEKRITSNFIILLFIMFALSISIIVSFLNYGQPFILGVLSLRIYIVILFILPFTKYLNRRKNISVFLESMNSIIVIISILLIIQFYLLDTIVFLGMSITTRVGEVRILIHTISPIICLVFAYNLDKFIQLKKNKLIYLFNILIYSYLMLFVVRTRIFILALLIIFVIEVIFLNNKLNYYIKGILLIICCCIVLSLLYTDLFQSIFSAIFKDIAKDKGNYVRFTAIDFYNSYIKNSFFGGGIINTSYVLSPAYIGEKFGYLHVDLGIYGFYYEFGIIGLMAFFVFILKIIKNIRRKKVHDINYRIMIIGVIIILSTITTVRPMEFYTLPVLIIISSLAFSNYNFIEEEENKYD